MKIASLVASFALVVGVHPTWAAVDCEPARCAVQAAIATRCPCDSDNHGRYVSCVAHVVRELAGAGTIPINCKGKVVRCAAKSVCGKEGFVTCQIPTDTCDLTTFHCVESPDIACLTDLDCGAKCRIKSSGDRCTALGGFVGTATSCCTACAE